jgi:nicotinamidase-related amidase
MPLTKLDPNAALLVVDLQKFVFSMPAVHPAAGIVARNAQLARAFRERGLPVVLIRVTGAGFGRTRTDAGPTNFSAVPPEWKELVPDLDPQPDDLIVTKPRWGAFIGTTLDYELRQRGVTQVFVTGVATSIGVESTARSAFEFGYHVVPVVDAMTDRDAGSHRHTVEKIFPRLGETETTENVLKALSGL